jgi:hypothetical protein
MTTQRNTAQHSASLAELRVLNLLQDYDGDRDDGLDYDHTNDHPAGFDPSAGEDNTGMQHLPAAGHKRSRQEQVRCMCTGMSHASACATSVQQYMVEYQLYASKAFCQIGDHLASQVPCADMK